MDLVGLNEDDIARLDRVGRIAFIDLTLPSKHIDFVLVRVMVLGSVAAWSDFELPHSEVRRPVMRVDKPTDSALLRTWHVYVVL